VIDLQKHLDQLSRIDFDDSSKPSMQQLQERLRDLLSQFPITGLTLWTLKKEQQQLQCRLNESLIEQDFRIILGDALPSLPLSSIEQFVIQMQQTKHPILLSKLSDAARVEIDKFRPEALKEKDILFHPVHSAQGLEGFIACRPEPPFIHWPESTFSSFLNHMLALSNAYMAYCQEQLLKQLNRQNELLNEIEKLAQIGSWEYDLSEASLYWSDETYRIYGLEPGTKVDPQQAISFYSPQSRDIIEQVFEDAISNSQEYQEELSFRDSKGNDKWVRTSGKIRKDGDQITHIYGAFEDITQEKQLIEYEQNASAYLQGILDNLNDVVLTVDARGQIITANRPVKKIFGYEPEELIGQSVSVLMPKPYSDMHDKYMHSYQKTGNAKIIGVGRELPAMRKNGEEFPMELSLSETLQSDKKVFIGIIRDISDRKEAEDKLYRLAFYDDLTGLPNRDSADAFFLLHNQPVADNKQAFLKTASELCQNILQHVSDELVINNHSHNLTLCIGSTLAPAANLKGSRLINMLEYATTRAKHQSGNTHITVDENTHAEIEHKAVISNSLIQALNNEEFSLVLQPQYDRDNRLVASEALIRWNSPELGFVSPAEFIPIAEDTGKIILIGDWVLNEVCKLLYEQTQKNIPTTIAVNISAKQIIQPDFCDKLLVITNKWLVTADKLILEITETTLVSDIELVKERMLYLSRLGFKFSIDDFGTGYSSLSYLRQLPLHELKIDRYFVDEIDLAGTDVPIVNSIIQMAKALGVSVVAEGVENEAQRNYLIEKGCDVLQGYHLNKPLSVDEWAKELQDQLA
jgi:PAS domain S-box-containing protein